jgi:hypothetical protein
MLMDPGLTHTGAAAEREIMFPNEKKKMYSLEKNKTVPTANKTN